MTLDEIEELRLLNMAHTLRLPKIFQTLDKKEMADLTNLRWGVCYLVKEFGLNQNLFRKSLLTRSLLRNSNGVERLNGLGSVYDPFRIVTKWGSGKFFNARLLFRNKEYPIYIEKQYCFDNCYYYARELGETNNLSCKVLSGIAFVKDISILHSVVEISNGWIIDFNYDICMEKELYVKLFGFEVLTELTSQEIFVKDRLLTKFGKYINCFGNGYRVFAMDDLINYAELLEESKTQARIAMGNF